MINLLSFNIMQQMININKLVINPEYESLLPPISDDDFKKLETSMLNEGILHPFVINNEKTVLDGHTRLRICKLHSIMQVPYIVRTFQSKIEEKEFVLSFNLNRRHLSTHQKIEIGLHILKIEMAKAKQRQIQAGTAFGTGHPKEHPPNQEEAARKKKESESMFIAAKKVELNTETLRKADKIHNLSEVDDDAKCLWNDVISGKCSIHKAYVSLQEREGEKSKIELVQNVNSKYSIININPPHYDYQKLKAIMLPLEEDAMVWLWSSNQFLPSAFALLESWGLRYRTMLTWVKTKRRRNNKQWLLDQTEHCLLATKGSPSLTLTDQSTVLIDSSNEWHKKPLTFYHLIDSLSSGKRIDLFPSERGE